MKTHNIDSYIFVKSGNKPNTQPEVVNAIGNMTGITSARQHPKIRGLVEISYNPGDVNYTNIVHNINAMGWESSFVGM